ncbi:twitching motility protein PilT [Ferrimonas sediminicola]|uniref:Twitching motility protein PilT n=1 Tax=Ferrimonas sediminicola TaxID=2569538 RepID=A0A4U1B665_9GAMM|nr:Mut7-C RNAse domain-containing protein [Ferrimonas sediminicola]TKB46013.1 twitching motility protein PilT [Ferrimonas sediminicola]
MIQDSHAPIWRRVSIRCHGDLEDFLPRGRRGGWVLHPFCGRPSAKSVLEAAGVPQAEIDLILVDGCPAGLDCRLLGGERLVVYPLFAAMDRQPLSRLRPRPLPKAFVVDANLGALARLLRLCGLDSLYRRDFDDDEIVRLARGQRRFILTRDKGILHYSAVDHGYWVRNTQPQRQLSEVIGRLRLQSLLHPFSRCIRCNGLIQPVARDLVAGRVPAGAWREHRHFFRCDGCGQIYWRGSHYRRMAAHLAALGLQTP